MESYESLKKDKIIRPFLQRVFMLSDLVTSSHPVSQLHISGSLYLIKNLPISNSESNLIGVKLLCTDSERLIVVLLTNTVLIKKKSEMVKVEVGSVLVPHRFIIAKCSVDPSGNSEPTVCLMVLQFSIMFAPPVGINKFAQKQIYLNLKQCILTCDPLISSERKAKLVDVTSAATHKDSDWQNKTVVLSLANETKARLYGSLSVNSPSVLIDTPLRPCTSTKPYEHQVYNGSDQNRTQLDEALIASSPTKGRPRSRTFDCTDNDNLEKTPPNKSTEDIRSQTLLRSSELLCDDFALIMPKNRTLEIISVSDRSTSSEPVSTSPDDIRVESALPQVSVLTSSNFRRHQSASLIETKENFPVVSKFTQRSTLSSNVGPGQAFSSEGVRLDSKSGKIKKKGPYCRARAAKRFKNLPPTSHLLPLMLCRAFDI